MYRTEGEKENIKKIPKNVRIQYLFYKPVKGIYKRWIQRRAYRKFDTIITLTNAARKRFVNDVP